eukprot:scaffold69205_cov32-Phaeocystis_antarctica.AAC.2
MAPGSRVTAAPRRAWGYAGMGSGTSRAMRTRPPRAPPPAARRTISPLSATRNGRPPRNPREAADRGGRARAGRPTACRGVRHQAPSRVTTRPAMAFAARWATWAWRDSACAASPSG